MGKIITLGYGIRHKTFTKNARYNAAVALFESDGCLAGVITCDPNGVYIAGDIPPVYHKYIGGGVYEVEVPDSYVVRDIAYAYETKHGHKFAIPVKHLYTEAFVSMKIGEYLQEKFDNEPICLYLQTSDSGLVLNKKDIIVNDDIDLSLPPCGREVGKVYGIKNPTVGREIYRNAYRKGIVHKNRRDFGKELLTKGNFSINIDSLNRFILVYTSYNHPDVAIKIGSAKEVIDTYNFMQSLYNAPPINITLIEKLPIIVILETYSTSSLGNWITAIDIETRTTANFPDNDSDYFVYLDEKQKELAEKALELATSSH